MKILVDKLPDKPDDCLFYKKEYSRAPYSGDQCITYQCSVDGNRCVCETCNKLMEVKYEMVN